MPRLRSIFDRDSVAVAPSSSSPSLEPHNFLRTLLLDLDLYRPQQHFRVAGQVARMRIFRPRGRVSTFSVHRPRPLHEHFSTSRTWRQKKPQQSHWGASIESVPHTVCSLQLAAVAASRRQPSRRSRQHLCAARAPAAVRCAIAMPFVRSLEKKSEVGCRICRSRETPAL